MWRETPVVLASYEAGDGIRPDALARYARLAGDGAFVAVLGADLDGATRGTDIRVARFPREAALAEEWSVVLVGAHYSGALVARRVGGGDCYDFAVTHDRELVLEAGRALLRQVSPDAW